MKKRIILWTAGVLMLLVLTRCHLIAPLLRRPDEVLQVKTSGYCSCGSCCGWKLNWFGLPVYSSGPNKGKLKMIGQTASGRMARPGTVAVDPSVFPMGTKFHIPGYGMARAEDAGGAIKGRHLDLFFWLHSSAVKWGVKTRPVKVWYPRD